MAAMFGVALHIFMEEDPVEDVHTSGKLSTSIPFLFLRVLVHAHVHACS